MRSSSWVSSTAENVTKETGCLYLSALSPASFSSWRHDVCSYSMGPFRPGSSQRKMSHFFCLLHRLLNVSEVLSPNLSSCVLVSYWPREGCIATVSNCQHQWDSSSCLLIIFWNEGCWEVCDIDHYSSLLLSVTECIIFSCILILLLTAANSLQSCPTLCDPIDDGSPPGSPIPGIFQERTLEWVAISFSSAWKWKVNVKSLSRVRLLATPWTAACNYIYACYEYCLI